MTHSPSSAQSAFERALQETYQMVDPFNPPPAGTYHRGQHEGIIAALKTIRANFDRAAASAHTIGEDAANVAIGEREAFEAWWIRDVHPEYQATARMLLKQEMNGGYAYVRCQAAWETWQARAALTAEKVAGIQPLTVSQAPTSQYAQGWNDCLKEANSPMTNGDFHCPACGEVMKGPTACGSCLWEADTCGYTAPQQPAQPVAQTLALTDEQIEDLQEAREILENMVRSVELDGNYSTEATCTFLRQALLCLPAAQPASGGA